MARHYRGIQNSSEPKIYGYNYSSKFYPIFEWLLLNLTSDCGDKALRWSLAERRWSGLNAREAATIELTWDGKGLLTSHHHRVWLVPWECCEKIPSQRWKIRWPYSTSQSDDRGSNPAIPHVVIVHLTYQTSKAPISLSLIASSGSQLI